VILPLLKKRQTNFAKALRQRKNPGLIKQAHELAGRIALQEKNYDQAIAELDQSNQQNPSDLYLLGEAYQGKVMLQKRKSGLQKRQSSIRFRF
jgi:tetratricopeptide (TPR) repeat protein